MPKIFISGSIKMQFGQSFNLSAEQIKELDNFSICPHKNPNLYTQITEDLKFSSLDYIEGEDIEIDDTVFEIEEE